MISWTFSLRYRETQVHSPVAWLIPGDDPADWFREWSGWSDEIDDWPLVVLPGKGVLVVPTAPPRIVSPTCVPFGRMGARIFVPSHGEWSPAASADELTALLPGGEGWALFLPQGDWIWIPEERIVSARWLLFARPLSERDWGHADPGPALNEKLSRTVPRVEPTLEAIVAAARDDIGREQGHGSKLPPHPGERGGNPVDKLAGAIARVLAMLGAGKPKKKGEQSSKPKDKKGQAANRDRPSREDSWWRWLTAWPRRLTADVERRLEELRHRELLRLMHMLSTNPDLGLKFAIPFGGGSHRGLAPPGARLGERDVEFHLSRYGGGGPSDPWDIPDEYRAKLTTRYRELANRELQLGRYRRAAYILGELLQDTWGAASALESGKHFREAAVLYRDRLKDPSRAAECLVRGGLLAEAIEILDRLNRQEQVGDLYARLEQGDNARDAYRRAAMVAEARGDYLDAARLREHKVQDADEALATLDRGWRHSRQAADCLERWFLLRGWRDDHPEVHRRLEELASLSSAELAARAAPKLAKLVNAYPEAQARRVAEDVVQRLAGRHLDGAKSVDREMLLAALAALSPGDRVLARDCERYSRLVPSSLARRVKVGPGFGREPRTILEFDLPRADVWLTAAARGPYWWALGLEGADLIVARGTWQGESSSIRAPKGAIPRLDRPNAFLAISPSGGPEIPVRVGPLAPSQALDATFVADEAMQDPCRVLGVTTPSTPADDVHSIVSAAYTMGSFAIFLRRKLTEDLLIYFYSLAPNSTLQSLSSADFDATSSAVPAVGDPKFLAYAAGRTLHVMTRENTSHKTELPSEVVSLAISPPHTRTRIVAGLEEGAALVLRRLSFDDAVVLEFARGLSRPRVCVSAGGIVVAASLEGVEIHRLIRENLRQVGAIGPSAEAPIAALPTRFSNHIALFSLSGKVTVYDVGSP